MKKNDQPEKGQPKKFSIKERLVSIKYAFNGLKIALKEEHNVRIHLLVAFCILIAGALFQISANEWIVIIFCISLVISLELINSAIENTADLISKERNESIKKIKDLSAGAVLVAAIASAIIGVIIFLPKIFNIFFC